MKTHLGKLIIDKRAELKESQAEFGKRFGLSHAAISDMERGVTTHYPADLFLFLFPIKYQVTCPTCKGEGFITEQREIKGL
jgi:transcriptional regulator with XRE-family HTH domain